jgi:hypothetical protein
MRERETEGGREKRASTNVVVEAGGKNAAVLGEAELLALRGGNIHLPGKVWIDDVPVAVTAFPVSVKQILQPNTQTPFSSLNFELACLSAHNFSLTFMHVDSLQVCSVRKSSMPAGVTVLAGQVPLHAVAAAVALKVPAPHSVQSLTSPSVAPTLALKKPAGQAVAGWPLAP